MNLKKTESFLFRCSGFMFTITIVSFVLVWFEFDLAEPVCIVSYIFGYLLLIAGLLWEPLKDRMF